MAEVALAARGVGKRFSGRTVLASVDLELPSGSLTRLDATNGAGKSTLLRVLAGVTPPDTGSVEGPVRTVGYVPDRWAPPSGFSARSFLRHMAALEGGTGPSRADEVLDRLAIRPSARSRLTALSTGNAQKVLCAHAFGRHREVLVLDEPANGLDGDAVAVLARLIAEARSDGTAVVLVDHGTLPVRPDHVVALRDGRVVAAAVDTDGAPVPQLTATITVDGAVDTETLPAPTRVVRSPSGLWVIRAREADVAAVLDRAVSAGWTVRAVDNPSGSR